MRTMIIHTDGGSRGNPGEAGIGFTITEGGEIINRVGRKIGIATNNEAEYSALIAALIFVQQEYGVSINLTCIADSELMVKQINGQYKVRQESLYKLYEQVKNTAKDFSAVEFKHVKREENKEADKLVNMALDGEL